jgi:hypothetical protein
MTLRSAMGSTQPPIQWVPAAVSCEVKRQGREADNSLPFSAEDKNGGVIPPLQPITVPLGLGHEPSSPARTLGSLVCAYSVYLFCVQVATLRRADPPSKVSYWLCMD